MSKTDRRYVAWGAMAGGLVLMAAGWPVLGVLVATVGLVVLGFSPVRRHSAKHIFYAIETGDLKTLRDMLGGGADPNLRYPGGPNLLEAAVRGRETAAVELLLEFGADPEATGRGQDSALAIAAFRNQRPSATLLINAGANPTTSNPGRLGGTPLSLAVGGGYERLCRTMLEKASVDDTMCHELEAEAVANGNETVARMLVEASPRTTSGEPAA
jgi:ankyrin repeat protein